MMLLMLNDAADADVAAYAACIAAAVAAYDADAYAAAIVTAYAASAADTLIKNRKETADICRKYLTIAIIEKLNG